MAEIHKEFKEFKEVPTRDHLVITAERDAALALLETRWTWLAANPNHPLHDERESAYLDTLAAYERLEDAIRAQPVTQATFADRADRYTR